jgi:hypothetical protein
MATGATDYSAYGLSNPFRGYRNGDDTNMSNENKVNQFAADMWEIFDSAGNLLLKKHRDYGPTNISLSPGGPLNGLRVRMHDKTARINHLIDNGATPENESLRDSFIDLLNYSAIALMVLDGVWPEVPEVDCD